ncbi:MAG: hypothetical protein SGILL_006138 [Bacillariaceae sp.]
MNLIPPDEPSAEAAYAVAIEAAAGLLQQATGDVSSASGYESSAETEDTSTMEEEEELDSFMETSINTSSGCSSFNRGDSSVDSNDSSSISSAEDIDTEIAYLKSKQKILERASSKLRQEQAYVACNARGILRGDFSRESKLWAEAKCVLDVLKKESKLSESSDSDPSPPKRESPAHQAVEFHIPAAKRPKIDLVNVNKVSAGSLRGNVTPTRSIISDLSTIASPALPRSVDSPEVNTIAVQSSHSHWMPQVMVYQIPALVSRNAITSLDVMLDPNVGLLVVSPEHLPFQNGIQLTKALEFTTSAQIIAMSTPPFAIVHVNKAFCEASGLSHADVIGKPVEEIIEVEQDIPSDVDSVGSPLPLQSRFLISDGKKCLIHVAPITDRSQNTRGMTHILVKIEEVADSSCTESISLAGKITSGTGADEAKLSAGGDSSQDDSSSTDSTRSHKVTIG